MPGVPISTHPDYVPTAPPPVDVYVCGWDQDPVFRVAAQTGEITPISGGGTTPALAVDDDGNVFLGDAGAAGGIHKIPAGGGPPILLAPGFLASGLAVDWASNIYAVGGTPGGVGYEAIKIAADGGSPSVIWTGDQWGGQAIAVDGFQNVYILQAYLTRAVRVAAAGGTPHVIDFSEILAGATFSADALAVDPLGQHLYVNRADLQYETVLKVPISGGTPTSLGTALSGVTGLAVDADENVYIADSLNQRVVAVLADTGAQVTICRTRQPLAVTVTPTHAHRWNPPDLIGQLFGAAAADGGGWLVVGDHFIPIPPRSPELYIVARTAARYLGRAIDNPDLGAQVRNLR